jgi:FAD/FMN-containing dehydrogenase
MGTALPGSFVRSLAAVVGASHVLTGDATAGFAVDWTGRFRGHAAAVARPRDTAEVAAILALCTEAGVAVVPQGGNTGLVGGGVPRHGEVVLSLTRLGQMAPVDRDAAQVTAGAGVTLQRVADADPDLDLGIVIASRATATVGGAVATNAGGLRVLRYGPMRAQLRGIEAVLADGTVLSHLAGLVKDNTGYDYPSMLAGSEGTLAVITRARLTLVPRTRDAVTVIAGFGSLGDLHDVACRAVRDVPGLLSAEFFTQAGLGVLIDRAGLTPPLAAPPGAPLTAPDAAYLLLEAGGPDALDALGALFAGPPDQPVAVAETAGDRARLWAYRERQPEVAGFLGVPIKLDVSVPSAQWVRLASSARQAVTDVDPGATVITFGHVADGNVHVNIVPAAPADGRHEDAVFSLVASLSGSISAEHGIGALKAPWLPLARSDAERALFARIRAAFDPSGTLNPHVFPHG